MRLLCQTSLAALVSTPIVTTVVAFCANALSLVSEIV